MSNKIKSRKHKKYKKRTDIVTPGDFTSIVFRNAKTNKRSGKTLTDNPKIYREVGEIENV